MRISTAQYYDTSAAKYQSNFSSIVKTNEQITSGVRIQTAGDDPVGAAKLLMLQQQKEMLTQYSGNMGSLKNSLANEESVLDSINTALQRARELALGAGDGSKSDADRKSIAEELSNIEGNILSLLNSKDASGQYMFSGSKTSTPPYVRNNDGTYTYQGDDMQLNLQVSDTLSLASNDTGKSVMESAINSGRTQAAFDTTPATPAGLTKANDGTVSVSAGLMTSNSAYTKSFAEGEPYKLAFTSSTEYKIFDKNNQDVTSQVSGNGKFDATKEGGSKISLRGVEFDITLRLKTPAPQAFDTVTNQPKVDANGDPVLMTNDEQVAGYTFNLATKPESFNSSRTPSNPSSTQITSTTITNKADYTNGFPSSGVVIKFDANGTDYKVYAQPYSDTSKSIGGGAATAAPAPAPAGSMTATFNGVKVDFGAALQGGDQFVIGSSSHKTQSALDTLSQLRKALETPSDNDVMAQIQLKDALNSAIGNLSNASEQVLSVQGAIGARLNSIDIQSVENSSLDLANGSIQAAIGNTDVATASIDLAFQQSLLQASQLAFVKISQLSLFNKM
ncbi:flagellar hook-associated protein 3 [Pseudomonas putida]|uniref:flagellar hook-associated protein 3 n=1 Tax=Pseudomonas putida TaxID=303 RepID=UPI00236385DD|nr:flagellar hook-associated protein 3 [Pseudomonas putida]MDD2055735.1 flagellar hook-associated protein 3 [Pseudomonas putida]